MIELRRVPFDHPDALRLDTLVQEVYRQIYGGGDATPIDARQFDPPAGHFVVGYVGVEVVACGGWRTAEHPELGAGAAEIKRMYVVDGQRGKGHARAVLAELERSAAMAGYTRTVLETGLRQPDAVALYESSGYARIPSFGIYRCAADSVCFGKPLTG